MLVLLALAPRFRGVLESGAHLYTSRLHGAVVRLFVQDGKVRAESELGDALVVDLALLEADVRTMVDPLSRRTPATSSAPAGTRA